MGLDEFRESEHDTTGDFSIGRQKLRRIESAIDEWLKDSQETKFFRASEVYGKLDWSSQAVSQTLNKIEKYERWSASGVSDAVYLNPFFKSDE